MKKAIAALLLILGLASAALAQVVTVKPFPEGGQTANLTASNVGTTGAITATLTGASNRFTYICGFVVTSGGTTAAINADVTVTGTISGTMHFNYVFVSSGQGILGIAFPGCISSSAKNTSIVINVPAGGAGTVVSASAWGYTN